MNNFTEGIGKSVSQFADALFSCHIFMGSSVYYNMLEFLPPSISDCIRHVNAQKLFEVRLRAQKPLRINFDGNYVYLGSSGIVREPELAYFPDKEEISDVLHAASGYSVHAVENQIRQGFITAKSGERIGICGDVVYENGKILSIHSITSLCIRVPHAVNECAEGIYRACLSDKLCSIVILSPPGWGKTTLLRDLSRLVCERKRVNVLVCDERGELSCGEVGHTADVVRYADKNTAFSEGIRAMCPDLIVTDELQEEDFSAVKKVRNGGLHVFASAHRTSADAIPNGLFDYLVCLSGLGKIGMIKRGIDCVV